MLPLKHIQGQFITKWMYASKCFSVQIAHSLCDVGGAVSRNIGREVTMQKLSEKVNTISGSAEVRWESQVK